MTYMDASKKAAVWAGVQHQQQKNNKEKKKKKRHKKKQQDQLLLDGTASTTIAAADSDPAGLRGKAATRSGDTSSGSAASWSAPVSFMHGSQSPLLEHIRRTLRLQ